MRYSLEKSAWNMSVLITIVFVAVSGNVVRAAQPTTAEQRQRQAIQRIEQDIRNLKETMNSWARYVCRGATKQRCEQQMQALRRRLELAERDFDEIRQIETADWARERARPGWRREHILVPGTNIYVPQGEGYSYRLDCHFPSGINQRGANSADQLVRQLWIQNCQGGKGRLVIHVSYRGKAQGNPESWDFKTGRRVYP